MRVLRTSYPEVKPYLTKDASEIRELMHPRVHGNKAQSLAEAMVPAGGRARLHRHRHSEEIYHVTAGRGLLRLGDDEFAIEAGDTVCIPPGTPHALENTGDGPLRVLCCCAPPYSHEDTELLPED